MIESFKFNLTGAISLYNKELPPVEYLVDDLIMKAGITYIVGPSGSFKTGLMITAAISGACRKKLLDYDIKKPFKTLFIDEENGIQNTKYVYQKILKGLSVDVTKELKDDDIIFANISDFCITPFHVDGLKEVIVKYKPDLIVIDNIARCLPGSERDEEDVSKILKLLKPVVEQYACSFAIIHHTRKGDAKSLEDISGSRDFGAQCDNAFLFKPYYQDSVISKFLIRNVKRRFGSKTHDINFSVQGNDDLFKIEYLGAASDNTKKLYEKIVIDIRAWIIEKNILEFTTKENNDAMLKLGYKESNVKLARNILLDNGELEKTKQGGWKCITI